MPRFFTLFEQFRIAEASADAMNARGHSERTRLEVDELRQQVETLALTCQAVCEILRDHLGIPEDVFLAKLEEVDLRDGVADGKITRQPLDCPSCGRRSGSKRRTCLYCGERIQGPMGPAGG